MSFNLGRLMATPGAIKFCEDNNIALMHVVKRHAACDWGDMCDSDKKQNDDAVRTGNSRIFSAYEFSQGTIWVITERDRSVTTVLLPEEY